MDTKALNNISYGLYVLFSESDGKANGCIINTAIQQTATPAKISVTVNKQNLTHDMIAKSGKFNISVLSEKAPFEIFKHFGFCSGRETDKIAGYNIFEVAKNGIVYLNKFANAFVSGEVKESIDLGTHTLFIADVTECGVVSEEPSATYEYYNKHIKVLEITGKTSGYRCVICGYVLDSDELPEDFICPVCKHGAADFEKITEQSEIRTYRCEVCGYEWKGSAPEKCPICDVSKENFKIK